jgi:hypothetical protein
MDTKRLFILETWIDSNLVHVVFVRVLAVKTIRNLLRSWRVVDAQMWFYIRLYGPLGHQSGPGHSNESREAADCDITIGHCIEGWLVDSATTCTVHGLSNVLLNAPVDCYEWFR